MNVGPRRTTHHSRGPHFFGAGRFFFAFLEVSTPVSATTTRLDSVVREYFDGGPVTLATWRAAKRMQLVRGGSGASGTDVEAASAPAAAGREIARGLRVEHTIHREDGQISEKNSYGNDPFPPKDGK